MKSVRNTSLLLTVALVAAPAFAQVPARVQSGPAIQTRPGAAPVVAPRGGAITRPRAATRSSTLRTGATQSQLQGVQAAEAANGAPAAISAPAQGRGASLSTLRGAAPAARAAAPAAAGVAAAQVSSRSEGKNGFVNRVESAELARVEQSIGQAWGSDAVQALNSLSGDAKAVAAAKALAYKAIDAKEEAVTAEMAEQAFKNEVASLVKTGHGITGDLGRCANEYNGTPLVNLTKLAADARMTSAVEVAGDAAAVTAAEQTAVRETLAEAVSVDAAEANSRVNDLANPALCGNLAPQLAK